MITQSTGSPESSTLRDAVRYWEKRRVIYTLVLVANVIVWLVLT